MYLHVLCDTCTNKYIMLLLIYEVDYMLHVSHVLFVCVCADVANREYDIAYPSCPYDPNYQ